MVSARWLDHVQRSDWLKSLICRIAFAWFTTFTFLSVISITFEEKKGWSHGIGGLPYIALCIGVSLAFGLNFLGDRYVSHRHEFDFCSPGPTQIL